MKGSASGNSAVKRKKWSRSSLVVQFAWAFVLMSIIPLLLVIFLLVSINASTLVSRIEQARIFIFWMLASSVAGYFVIRKAVGMLSKLEDNVRDVVSGNLSRQILLNEENEIGHLARYFNDITKDLELKIQELKVSKRLIQNIFHKVGEAISSSRGIDSLLELILQSLSSAIGARGGFIMFVSADGRLLEPSVMYSSDSAFPEVSSVRIEQSLIGEVIKERKPMVISCERLQRDGWNFKNLFCVPLDYKDKIIGLIAVYDKKTKESFVEEELNIFKDVAAQTAMAIANFQLNLDIEKAYLDTVRALAMAVEAKDIYSGGHLERVARYATDIGKRLGLSGEDIKILHDCAYLHDLGKIGISDSILLKHGKLTFEEFQEMKRHPIIGETILRPIKSLSRLCEVVRAHQERWDGSGYPDGLKGENIPLDGRILAVADVYDALTTTRPYKKAMTKEDAKAELEKLSGVKLDKKIVEVFLQTV